MTTIKGKVKAVSGPNEFQGVLQIGFTLEEDKNKWYNIAGMEKILKDILNTMVKKGAEIEFDEDPNKNVTNMKLIQDVPKKEGNWEDDIVSFETLLTKAHSMNAPFSIKTWKLEVDLEKKYALFKARVIVDGGTVIEKVFDGHGDSTEDNVKGEHIKPHFIRLAETRAIVRALRWYTNNANCTEEEK